MDWERFRYLSLVAPLRLRLRSRSAHDGWAVRTGLKLLELSDELSRQDLDIMLLSETWLRPSTPYRLLVIPGYSISRVDRPDGRGYGGVAIITKVDITPVALKPPGP